MKKITNGTHLEGYLFSHTLEVKTSGENAKTPGTVYIAGAVEIVTDEQGLNVVPVHYTYVTEKTKAGKDNATFKTLKSIIDSKGETYQDCGTGAMKLKADTALAVNDFYGQDGNLITYKRNEGGFLHIVQSFSENRNSFEVDMLITNAVMREADEERGTDDALVLTGATFNFMGTLLPIDLLVKDPAGISYFESLAPTPSEPVFIKIWGNVWCSTIDTQVLEESAFGAPAVKTSSRKLREWVVSGAARTPYDFGDETVLTADEVKKAMAARETALADMKKRNEEYQASKNAAPAAGFANPTAAGFNF